MLTEKDYCDYDTSRELKELGFVAGLGENDCGYCLYDDAWHDQVNRPLLYEAQKWLREKKNIIVDVRYGAPYYNVVLNHRITNGYHIVKDKNNRIADFIEYEKALSDGVKCAVKLLKENETIHR